MNALHEKLYLSIQIPKIPPCSIVSKNCVYRELLYDVLQQGSVSQQLVVDGCVLQQHGQDLSELWQLLLAQISNTHQLQNHSQQARNAA